MADDIITNSSPDLSSILGGLMANKELVSKIGEIVNNSQTEPSTSSSADSTASIDGLLSNPDIMAKLPDVISAIKPLMAGEKTHETGKSSLDRRIGLLMAMKPYLSPKRCEAIDYIAKMSKLSETVKGLKF
jgi:hypothetical protein